MSEQQIDEKGDIQTEELTSGNATASEGNDNVPILTSTESALVFDEPSNQAPNLPASFSTDTKESIVMRTREEKDETVYDAAKPEKPARKSSDKIEHRLEGNAQANDETAATQDGDNGNRLAADVDVMPFPVEQTALRRHGRAIAPTVPGAQQVPGVLGRSRMDMEANPEERKSEELTEQQRDVPDSHLVEAMPVRQGSSSLNIGEATEVNEHGDSGSVDHKRKHLAILGIIAVLTTLTGSILTVVFLLSSNETSTKSGSAPKDDNELTERGPINEHVLSLLPLETLEDIHIEDTSQHRAFMWLLGDPLVDTYTDRRLIQRFSLAVFYFSTSGDKWFSNDNWLSYEQHECNWFFGARATYVAEDGAVGLSSSFVNGLVQGMIAKDNQKPCIGLDGKQSEEYKQIALFNNGLRGSVPNELFLLTGIQFLGLYGNSLSGTISASIGGMKDLVGIILIVNDITGSFPPELASITSLRLIMASSNAISGSLPTQMGLLTELEHLWLDDNLISGAIPSEIAQMQQLQTLLLREAALSGSIPTQMGRMDSMWLCMMADNNLSGKLPSELGQLKALQVSEPKIEGFLATMPGLVWKIAKKIWMGRLEFSRNSLTGPVPSELALLPGLKHLFIESNQLTGSMPTEFGMMTSMLELWLFGNKLSGFVPSELGLMKDTYRLILHSNNLVGSIPTELGGMTSMTKLELHLNALTATIPSEFGLMTSMEDLWLFGNKLSGLIPTEFALMKDTSRLILHTNNLIGSIPTELGKLTSMTKLELHRSQLTGKIPSEFGRMTSMNDLWLLDNKLSGTIPSELGLMKDATLLILYSNSLTGAIPSELGLMTILSQLELYDNQLTGKIISELGMMTSMDALWLSGNMLSGFIPTELGQMSTATIMQLFNNSLEGPIPSELGKVSSLHTLTLHNNQLTGQVPSILSNVPTLSLLLLSGNSLEGSLSSDLCGIEELVFDCSEVLCGCTCNCSDNVWDGEGENRSSSRHH